MPDFPRAATAAEVWAYGTRTITEKTGFEIAGTKTKLDDLQDLAQSDILTDATPFPGASIDAAISSRSSHAAAAIWAVGARTITALTGTPRSDLLGEDATFEAGTGARKVRIDDTPAFETPVETSIVMDGTEKILVEKTDDKMGMLDGYVDLTPMQAGDTIVIRQYMKVKAAGNYIKYAEESYSGAQTIPLLHVVTKTAKTSIKVTAQQTAGTNRTLDVQFFRRVEA